MNQTDQEKSKVSIALCTYNGENYLQAQWQSLLEQQRLPDEVVICDDGSSDQTVDLLHRLSANAPFEVRIITNRSQLGFNKNFEKALSLCTGDLIFICDQDDFWLPEKVQTMVTFMNQRPAIQLAFNNAWVADENLNPMDLLFWDQVRFDTTTQRRWKAGEALDVLLDGNRMMGCASVIRRQFLPRLLPIPVHIPGYIYDGWLAMVAAAYGVIDFVDKPMQLYRIHVRQQVGVSQENTGGKPVSLWHRFSRDRTIKLEPLQEKHLALQFIFQSLAERVPANAPGMPQIQRRLAHYQMRSSLPANRLKRISPVMQNVWQGNYHRYTDASANWYAPYLAALGDLLE
ncbi:glycosyltransferase [Nibrella saemangeumensis]|uniref:Glycosyltransferase n=1 Tax=Nibrella saemangeumensis TaxID=1084526 RepID=A0ABP8ND29_9BACT